MQPDYFNDIVMIVIFMHVFPYGSPGVLNIVFLSVITDVYCMHASTYITYVYRQLCTQ